MLESCSSGQLGTRADESEVVVRGVSRKKLGENAVSDTLTQQKNSRMHASVNMSFDLGVSEYIYY